MARNIRRSRFRSRGEVGEDVNPSAYIVNLADCMLVLACGFMVALISYWNIDVTPAQKLDSEELAAVDPQTLPADVQEGGSYYIEAGKVYQDPNTGQLYMVQSADEGSSSVSGAAGTGGSATTSSAGTVSASTTSGALTGSGSATSSGTSNEAIIASRASGGD